MVEAFTKFWERIADPDPSPDPVVRNLQATVDKQFSEELTGDDAMDFLYGTIHQEAVKSLPEKITTTSHYWYILTRMRRDKERRSLHSPICSVWTPYGMGRIQSHSMESMWNVFWLEA